MVGNAHSTKILLKSTNYEFQIQEQTFVYFLYLNAKAEIIKWVAGMLVAQAAIVATLVKLL